MLFSRQFEVQKWKFEQNLKIWKSKMATTWRIYLTIVVMETNKTPRGFTQLKVQMKFAISTKFQVNRMNCVESGRAGRGSDGPLPPPPFKASCNYFF